MNEKSNRAVVGIIFSYVPFNLSNFIVNLIDIIMEIVLSYIYIATYRAE
jgi:hypothetical protein